MTPERRAYLLMLKHAEAVYQPQTRRAARIPLDVKCPGCGFDRESCDRPLCSRLLSEAEA